MKYSMLCLCYVLHSAVCMLCSKSISSTEVQFYNLKCSYKMARRLVLAAIFERDGHSVLGNRK